MHHYQILLNNTMAKKKTNKKGKKKGKKGAKKGKKTGAKSSAPKVILSKEEQIQKCISEHLEIIQMMWHFIVGPLNQEQTIREALHKAKCKENNTQYTPKASIRFERLENVIETTTDITQKQDTNKPNLIHNIMLDIFEWFDSNARGLISYKEFEKRMGEFFQEENASKPKKKTKAKAKKGKKKGAKSKKKKK
eukprot:445927_1